MDDALREEYLSAEIDRNLQAAMEEGITVKGPGVRTAYLKVNLDYDAYDFLTEQLLPQQRFTFPDLKMENIIYHSTYGKAFMLIPGRW